MCGRVEDEIRLVRQTAAGHRDVEGLPGGGRIGQDVGGVGGHALGAVHGGGVGEFHVPADILGGKRDRGRAGIAVVVEQPDGERAITAGAVDDPLLAVADVSVSTATTVGLAGFGGLGAVGQEAVNFPGDDAVTSTGGEPVAQDDGAGVIDGAGSDEIGPGSLFNSRTVSLSAATSRLVAP